MTLPTTIPSTRPPRKVDFYRHSLPVTEAEKIAAVLATPFLTTGPVSKRVEEQLMAFFGTREAVLMNSWTNGAVAALLAAGIKRGDEVIVPAMTFVATANVVEMVGAKPVFVDVDPETLLLAPEAIAKAVTTATKAIIPVHLYGQMVDMRAVREAIGGREDILLIEDCAHCFEGTLHGDRPGTHSDMAIFSFYATKNVACGEGGAVVLNDSVLADRIRQARQHGMSAGAVDRFKTGGYRHWDVERLGTKANLPDLLAAFLPAQIEGVLDRSKQRTLLAKGYRTALERTPFRLPHWQDGQLHAHHLFPIGVPGGARDQVLGLLAQAGIGATVNYRSVPLLSYYTGRYGHKPEDHPHAFAWGEETLTLPLYPGLSGEDQQYVIDVLLEDIAPRL